MHLSKATAEIDLAAISNNFSMAQVAAPDCKVMAIVKADAYGHGAVPVARCLESADALGVARIDEAVTLREANIKSPITLLEGLLDSRELEIAKRYGLDLVIHSEYQLAMLTKDTELGLWLKLETGMHRLGLPCELLATSLSRLDGHNILGLMGHLSDADQRQSTVVEDQLQRFLNATESVPYKRSLANSAAILGYPETHVEWVRPGLMLYGATPFTDLAPNASLSAAMSLVAPIIAIKTLQKGDTVGYGSQWMAEKKCRIAVVAIGYADGYPREAAMGTPVLINGKRRRLVGRVSMDMLTVELQDEDNVAIGDGVELWGKNLPIEEISGCAGTIPYTLMCAVSRRVPREYIEHPGAVN
jgi:alanine racemase